MGGKTVAKRPFFLANRIILFRRFYEPRSPSRAFPAASDHRLAPCQHSHRPSKSNLWPRLQLVNPRHAAVDPFLTLQHFFRSTWRRQRIVMDSLWALEQVLRPTALSVHTPTLSTEDVIFVDELPALKDKIKATVASSEASAARLKERGLEVRSSISKLPTHLIVRLLT